MIGCGINNITGAIFFTKNGLLVGTAFERARTDVELYPAVGMSGPGERVYVNFGQAPFAFDFDFESTTPSHQAPRATDSSTPVKPDTAEQPLPADYDAISSNLYPCVQRLRTPVRLTSCCRFLYQSPLIEALERTAEKMQSRFGPLGRGAELKGTPCQACKLAIQGMWYSCSACERLLWCADCKETQQHTPQHLFIAVHNPSDDSCNSKFQPVRFKNSSLLVHPNTVCDKCNVQPIVGVRYEKLDLSGFSKYDLCAPCHHALPVVFDANFLQITAPLDRDVVPQEKVSPSASLVPDGAPAALPILPIVVSEQR